jgi:uncharacterized integral membrane protein
VTRCVRLPFNGDTCDVSSGGDLSGSAGDERPPPVGGTGGEGVQQGPPTRRGRMRHRAHKVRLWSWTTLLVVAVVVIIALIVDNTRKVDIGWVFGSGKVSLVWIILSAAIVGWLAGLATSFVVRRRMRRVARR